MTTGPRAWSALDRAVAADLASGRCATVVTRFRAPPEGRAHLGHAREIALAWGLAERFGGRCHLRTEGPPDPGALDALLEDVAWLGFDPGPPRSAAEHDGPLLAWASHLVRQGKAYVDEQTADLARRNRGTSDDPGVPSPWRHRPASESLDRLERMARGAVEAGAMVLRARIDMGHPNPRLRDPVMYAVVRGAGAAVELRPSADWSLPARDAREGVTHALDPWDRAVDRELYDWFLDQLPLEGPRPRPIGVARLSESPALDVLRRRGFTGAAIRDFVERMGLLGETTRVDPAVLAACARRDLDRRSPRVSVVLDPVSVTISGPSGDREVLVERADLDLGNAGGRGLGPGRVARLWRAGLARYVSHRADADGHVTGVRCVEVEQGSASAVLHWVSAASAVGIAVHLEDGTPLGGARAERDVLRAPLGTHLQLVRSGYFLVEAGTGGAPSLRRVVPLRAPTSESPPRSTPPAAGGPPRARELGAAGRDLLARGLSRHQASVLERHAVLRAWFDQAVTVGVEPSAVAGLVVTRLPRLARAHGGFAQLRFGGRELGELARMVHERALTAAGARRVLELLAVEGGRPRTVAEERGLAPIADPEVLGALVDEVVAAAPASVASWRAGRVGVVDHLVGDVVRRTGGRADAGVARELILAVLSRR